MDNNDDSSTSVTDEEEEEEMPHKEIISSEMAPKQSQQQCDQPIMDEQQSICDVHQFEKDKKAVYKHPLFPLLGNSSISQSHPVVGNSSLPNK